ncbi:MAG TPA: hypothetical protein VGH73_12305 [Thermoanaerobaculia bacterium]|jgi:hypothetical protein
MATDEQEKSRPSTDEWDWFRVTFDDRGVTLDVTPANEAPWRQSFAWSSVIRVCFKPEEWISDGLYIFTRERPQSYVIPVECSGGAELLDQLIVRDLFGAKVAIEAASSIDGLFCWPLIDLTPDVQAMTSKIVFQRAVPDLPEALVDQPLNAGTLAVYLVERFPDREHSKPKDVSELLSELLDGGVKTIVEVEAILEAAQDAIAGVEAEKDYTFADVGIVRVSARIFDSVFYYASERWGSSTRDQLEAKATSLYGKYRHLIRRPS